MESQVVKKIFAQLKTFFDVWKMWLFVGGLLASTNGAQMYANYEPEKADQPIKKAAVKPSLQKTIIIYKTDNSYCDKKLDEHYKSWRH